MLRHFYLVLFKYVWGTVILPKLLDLPFLLLLLYFAEKSGFTDVAAVVLHFLFFKMILVLHLLEAFPLSTCKNEVVHAVQ